MQIVITLGDAQDEREGLSPGEHDVGGVSLAQRALRSAQVAEASEALVLSGHSASRWEWLCSDRVIGKMPTTLRQVEGSVSEPLVSLRASADALDEELVVLPGDRVITPGLLKPLLVADRGPRAVIDEAGEVLALRVRRDELVTSHATTFEGLLEELGELRLPREVVAQPELLRVRDAQDAVVAKTALFKTLRKPLGRQTDGLTAYLINRPISLSISRLLLHTPVRPNHITAFDVMLGLVAGVLLASGDVATIALGALLMQLVSIFDGIDGELARMKVLMSLNGERFDSMGDEVVIMAMFIGLGVSSYKMTLHPSYLWAMGIGAFATLLTVVVLYRELAKKRVGTLNGVKWWFEDANRPATLWQSTLTAISYILKRDTFTLLLMVIAAIGFPQFSFWGMLLGIAIISISTFGQRAVKYVRGSQVTSTGAAELPEEMSRA